MVTDLTRWATRLRKIKAKQVRSPRIDSETMKAQPGVLGITKKGEQVHGPSWSNTVASHVLCLAATGSGKTVLISKMLVDEYAKSKSMRKNTKMPSYVIVDPKGDLIKGILEMLADTDPDLLSSCHYLDPFVEGFAFNLVHQRGIDAGPDIRALQLAQLVSSVSSSSSDIKLGLGARQLDVLYHLLLAVLSTTHPKANILWALDALGIEGGLELLASLTSSPQARQYLLSTKLSGDLRASTASRLRTAFSLSQQIERTVCSPDCIDLDKLVAPGQIILINLGLPTGGLSSLQKLWANLLVRTIMNLLLARPSPWHGHHCRLVIDEAQLVAPVLADTAEVLLTTGRSRGLSLVLLSQGTALLGSASENLLQVILTNMSFKLIGRLSYADAAQFAKEQVIPTRRQPNLQVARNNLASSICNLPDRAFYYFSPTAKDLFTASTVDMARIHTAGRSQAQAIVQVQARHALGDMKARFTLLEGSKVKVAKPTKRQAESRGTTKWG